MKIDVVSDVICPWCYLGKVRLDKALASLPEIKAALASLPEGRTPTKADWTRLSASWAPRLDERIAALQRLRDRLTGCIGCGCLSLKACALYNPEDAQGRSGQGARRLLQD